MIRLTELFSLFLITFAQALLRRSIHINHRFDTIHFFFSIFQAKKTVTIPLFCNRELRVWVTQIENFIFLEQFDEKKLLRISGICKFEGNQMVSKVK